jgi:hypothetical protein
VGGEGEEPVWGIVVVVEVPAGALGGRAERVFGGGLVGSEGAAVAGGESGAAGRVEQDEPAAGSSDAGEFV